MTETEGFEDASPPPSDRVFARTLGGVALAFALLPMARHGAIRAPWALGAIAMLALGEFAPARLALFNGLWHRFGLMLQSVTAPVVLGGVFYGLVTPLGILRRWIGNDALRLRDAHRSETSLWIPRTPPGPAPQSLRNLF